MNTITRFRQQGLTTVEMAIVGALMMIMLFALLEFGRLLWTWGTLAEVTRHTARAAAVCQDDQAVHNVAVFGNIHGNGSKMLPDLTAAHINLEYLDVVDVENPDALEGEPQFVRVVNIVDINDEPQLVRVSIVDYEIRLAIPMVNVSLTAPPFTTTQPVESLGKAITCKVY